MWKRRRYATVVLGKGDEELTDRGQDMVLGLVEDAGRESCEKWPRSRVVFSVGRSGGYVFGIDAEIAGRLVERLRVELGDARNVTTYTARKLAEGDEMALAVARSQAT
jgi:hypothetical protein